MKPDLAGHRAVVTGASSGIGAAMAKKLAAWGADLVLVARRVDRLEALAGALREECDAAVEVVEADLLAPDAPARLYDEVTAGDRPVTILVNNAGFGIFETFHCSDWEAQEAMVRLNVLVLAELTHRFLGPMVARGTPAYVLNVASIGAYQPVPYMAAYGAAKAFVRNFTEALNVELAGSAVSATSLCPGATDTEFFDVARQEPGRMVRSTMISAERCAEIGLRAMLRRRANVVSGGTNKLTAWLTRFAPRSVAARMAAVVMGRPDDAS